MFSCLTTAIAMMPTAGTSQSSCFPVFASDFLGLSLLNTSAANSEVTVTWTSGDGNITRSGSQSLAPGAQRASLLRDILGTSGDPQDGWIRLDSTNDGLRSYLTSGTQFVLEGTDPVTQPDTTIFLGHISIQTGFFELEYTDTFATFVNPGDVPSNARADLIGLDGRTLGSQTFRIPGSGSRVMRVSEAFSDVLPTNNLGGRSFSGYMKVVSDAPIAAWVRIETPLSRRLLRGRGIGEIDSVTLAMAAHFAFGSANLYRSTLNLVNIGAVAAALEIAAQDDRGAPIGNIVRLTLAPGQGIREDVTSLFKVVIPAVFPPLPIAGYVRVRTADGSQFRIVGDVDIYSGSNRAAMMYPIETTAGRDWTMPFVVSGSNYFTGFAIANPNELLTVQADVTIELLDTEGRTVSPARTLSLSPSARFAGLVKNEMQSGYLHIHANGPVIVMGSIGTCSGDALAFLPAFR